MTTSSCARFQENARSDLGRLRSSNRVEVVPLGLIKFHGHGIVRDLGVHEIEERSVDVLEPEVGTGAGARHFRVRGEETINNPVMPPLLFRGARTDSRSCCIRVPLCRGAALVGPDEAFVRLRDYTVCVAVSRVHPLARRKRVVLPALQQERLMVYSRTEYPEYHSWLNQILNGAIRSALANGEEHENGSSIVAAVEAGRGIAIVPSVFSAVAGPRLVFRELHPRPVALVVGLAYHRRHLGPAARQFLKTVGGLSK
jgi:DNA-binding transcriptional LysR family regulator